MKNLCIVFLLLLMATPVAAQPLDIDTIAKQPGTTVTRQMQGGNEFITIERAGVEITISGDRETSMDRSGKAVLCYWNLAIVVKIATDNCYPDEFPALSKMLGEEIDEANRFIAANSLRPVTKEQLEKNIEERTRKAQAGIKAAGVPPAQNKVCQQKREEDILPMNADLEKYRREFKDVLAVSRPPAQNPCY